MIQLAHQEMTKLGLALEEACRSMPHGGDHRLRRFRSRGSFSIAHSKEIPRLAG
jgi:hypothetical protein